MPVIPLVTLAQIQDELSGVLPKDSDMLPSLILAASRAVQKYCKQNFAYWSYDETYSGNGFARLVLRQYPLNRLLRLSCNPVPALTIVNRDNVTNQLAFVTPATIGDQDSGLSQVGVALSTTASGVTTNYLFFYNQPPVFTFTVAATGTGGTIPAGTYLCAYSIVGSSGESVMCPPVSVVVTTGQVLSFTFPRLPVGATGFSLYVSTTNGGAETMTRQASGGSGPITLTSLVSGAAPATAANVTVQALANSINGLSSAWVATPQQGYSLYPTSDFRPLQGAQGALQGRNSGVGLSVYATELTGYVPDYEKSIIGLVNTNNYDPVFSLSGGSLFTGFPYGDQNIRAVYEAGYTTVPADVEKAVTFTIQDWIWQLQTVRIFRKESGDRYSYEFFNRELGLPEVAKSILSNGWRSYRRK